MSGRLGKRRHDCDTAATTHLLLDTSRRVVQGVELIEHQHDTGAAEGLFREGRTESRCTVERRQLNPTKPCLLTQVGAEVGPELGGRALRGDAVEIHDQVLPAPRARQVVQQMQGQGRLGRATGAVQHEDCACLHMRHELGQIERQHEVAVLVRGRQGAVHSELPRPRTGYDGRGYGCKG